MTEHHQSTHHPPGAWRHWLILVAMAGLLFGSLGCSLGRQLGELDVLAAGPGLAGLATRTPWPTFTPTPSPSPWPTFTPTPTPSPTPTFTATPTASATPLPTPAPSSTPLPGPTPTFTATPLPPVAPSPTLSPTPSPTPAFAYQMLEVYEDTTSNPFLTGYIAIVNAQEIPIGGVKAVGAFEPGGAGYQSPLSPWFFDARSAPGAVVKTGSVKFEPGSIQAGTWFIHLENEQGDRLSQDVAIHTDPANPKWFYIKFKQPGSPLAMAPTPASVSGVAAAAAAAPAGSLATASTDDWTFINVRSTSYLGMGNALIYGEAVNTSGSAQQILSLKATFYDSQGQVLTGTGAGNEYWPVSLAPAGARVPFKFLLYGVNGFAKFDLQVVSRPSSVSSRQDFQISDLGSSDWRSSYCVQGTLRNPGPPLQNTLTVAAILYDVQGQVISFESYDEYFPQDIQGDDELDFEVCSDLLGQEVARYEVRGWGR